MAFFLAIFYAILNLDVKNNAFSNNFITLFNTFLVEVNIHQWKQKWKENTCFFFNKNNFIFLFKEVITYIKIHTLLRIKKSVEIKFSLS